MNINSIQEVEHGDRQLQSFCLPSALCRHTQNTNNQNLQLSTISKVGVKKAHQSKKNFILKLCLVIQVSYIYWAQHSRLFSLHDLRVETVAAFKT